MRVAQRPKPARRGGSQRRIPAACGQEQRAQRAVDVFAQFMHHAEAQIGMGQQHDQDLERRLVAAVAERGFSVTLLEGVTGSGKTEVYFEAVAQALRQGRQALVMLPEIALTAQFLDRFAARFGARPAEWHSGVSPRKRTRRRA